MDKRLLLVSGEGIGNFIQLMPTIRTLRDSLGYSIDYFHAFGSYSLDNKLCPYVDNFFLPQTARAINPANYSGSLSTFWARGMASRLPPPLLSKVYPLSMEEAEVDTYMKMAIDLGAKPADMIYDTPCNYNKSSEEFDVVISDGYNRHGSANWSIKSYPHYTEVVSLLNQKGYNVCSIGSTDEYIPGTIDKTGLTLLDSIGIIAKSKVFLGNDSGMYHCAASLGVPSIVVFTATSVLKNYHPQFHKSVHYVVREDLNCRPCQKGQGWKRCDDWKCRDIRPEVISTLVKDKMV